MTRRNHPVSDPALPALPEPLPDDWREVLPPVDIHCDCNGERHRITWAAGRPTLRDHTAADDAYTALGGTDGCHTVTDAVTDAQMSSYYDGLVDRLLAETDYTFGGEDAAQAILARVHPAFGVPRIAQIACADWMTANGARAVRVGDIHVIVDTNGYGRVGMYAVWGEGVAPRALVMIAADWYDHVREHGYTRAGRFVCGTTEDGLVVSSTSTDKGRVTFTAAIIDGNPDVTFEQPRIFVGDLDAGWIIVGGCADVVDLEYHMAVDVHYRPVAATTSYADAAAWLAFTDVYQTFTRDDLQTFTRDDLRHVASLDEPQACFALAPHAADLIRGCVLDSVDPATRALSFATVHLVAINDDPEFFDVWPGPDDRGYAQ